MKADGGAVDEFLDLPLANPSFDERWLDRAAGAYAKQKPELLKPLFREGSARENRPPDRDYSHLGLFGELKGTAPEDSPVAIKTKNPLVQITEGDIDRGMDVGMGGGPGTMVGPYGAFMLRQAAREAGKAAAPHPVYAKEVEDASQRLRPEFRDAYKGWQQDARDAQARGMLEMRQGSKNPFDNDVWEGAGWFRGAEGMPRKEIPDIGAKLEPLYEGSNKFQLVHPAGDLHKIYEIPPIEFDPRMKAGNGAFDPDTKQIILGGSPTPANLKKATSAALHEIEHVIQKTEGHNFGSNPIKSLERPELTQEYFPTVGKSESAMGPPNIFDEMFGGSTRTGDAKTAHLPSWQADLIRTQEKRGSDPLEAEKGLKRALFKVYQRSSGETEARNVQGRRAKSFKYKLHPESTEDIPRGLQWHEPGDLPRKRKDIKIYRSKDEALRDGWEHDSNPNHWTQKASGGATSAPPWFVKNQARGASSGMLKSSIPGRTDKIPLKVGGGSYVLPADIPSALGQGNTMAGGAILDKMFQRGPYGMNLPKAKAGMSTKMSRMSSLTKVRKSGFAEGGDVGQDMETPIIAAGGEYILSPEQVIQVGGGDMDRGHKILDKFVLDIRSQHIKTLKGLKPPKKD